MDGKRHASVRASVQEAVSTAREVVAESQQARAQARERVQETHALRRRIYAERERDAGKI